MGIHISNENGVKKSKKRAARIAVFCVMGLVTIGATSIAVRATCMDKKGLTVNNIHMEWHDVPNYKQLVEPTLKPTVFTKNNEILTEGFVCYLDTHEFTKDDIGKSFTLDYTYSFDKEILANNLKAINDSATKSTDAYIDTDKVKIVAETYGTEIDIESVIAAIDGESVIELSDYYIKPEIYTADLESAIEEYNKWSHWGVKYKDYDYILSAGDSDLSIDEQGNITVVSIDFINDYVENLSEDFKTQGEDYEFVNHNGETITVPGGTLGSTVDTEKETEELIELFKSNKTVTDKEINYDVHREIEDEYIEVSIDEQHVWYYKDGEVLWESDCVSGCSGKKNDTTKGMWYLDIVDTDRMLHPGGDPVGTHVDYWMRFTPAGEGLHDAPWRSKFGGNIYKTNGSHGCVNLPPKKAKELYQYAHYGLPVVVY